MRTPEDVAREWLYGIGDRTNSAAEDETTLTDVIREYAEQVRAETLAGFTEERAWSDVDGQRYFTVGYPASDPSLHTVRRLVGPWEPVEP